MASVQAWGNGPARLSCQYTWVNVKNRAIVQSGTVVVPTAAAEAARLAMLDCQGLLAKPINLDELRGLVSALLHEVTTDAV